MAFTHTLADLKPMLLTEAKAPWVAVGWEAELKHDGYRARVQVAGDQVEIRTRNGADATAWWPEIGAGLAGLTKSRTVLDGEAVVLDGIGRSDFERLHARSRRRRSHAGADAVTFVAFDVLVLRGRDVRALPLVERRAQLARLLASPRPDVLLSQAVPGEQAPQLYAMAVQLKLEGIVLKRLSSPYQCGQRSDDWVKVKRPGATPAQRFERGDLSLG
jgi:bifunctional non-homologous end joining protein LigD